MATTLLQLLGGKGMLKDVTVTGLTVDSRNVSSGDLFVALPGTKYDGRNYIAQAVSNGASAVLTTPGSVVSLEGMPPVIENTNPRKLYAQMAARFCGPQPTTQVAVTGTNGKTSVAEFTRQIWQRLGFAAASVGTLGVSSDHLMLEGGLTTPDPMSLYSIFNKLHAAGVNNIAVEASSHGLDQNRLDGMHISAAAFTNLTRDHLDYHKNEQAYFYAKARLFGTLLAPGAAAVINIDDPWGRVLDDIAWGRSLDRLTYGHLEKAHLRIMRHNVMPAGQEISVSFQGITYDLSLPLIGEFQAMNALAAAGLVISTGANASDVLPALEHLQGVPGRMELMGLYHCAGVYVDYAHTPGGLETVLSAAKAHQPKKLHVVFGCGGDRDAGKRPQMGKIAADFADHVYVTDDNPRSEPPAAIRAEILAACPQAIEIGDRAKAIQAALDAAREGDMVIIAGKGHETGQTIGDQILTFSDIEVVRALLDAEIGKNPMPRKEKDQ